MDTKQKHAEAGEEEEEGNMQESRQCFDRPVKMQPRDAFGEECSDPRPLARTVSRLGYSEITPRPLLQQCR